MAYSAPLTVVAGSVLTAAYGNSQIRDNTAYLKGVVDGTGTDRIPSKALAIVSARKTQRQTVSILNATDTRLFFDTTNFDNGTIVTTGSPDILTIPRDGYYQFGATLLWFINAVGMRTIEVHAKTFGTTNDLTLRQQRILAVGDSLRTPNEIADYRFFTAGDQLWVICSQSSGAALSLDIGQFASSFWVAFHRDNS